MDACNKFLGKYKGRNYSQVGKLDIVKLGKQSTERRGIAFYSHAK